MQINFGTQYALNISITEGTSINTNILYDSMTIDVRLKILTDSESARKMW